MSFLATVFLALGLAMDATAVAGARGLASKREIRARDALLVALLFGGSQAAMPAIGWALGGAFASRIMGWGHWVTFVVLGVIGAKMLYEAFVDQEEDESKVVADAFDLKVLALLAIATSIDALAAGVTLALAHVSIVAACSAIGLITAVLSFAGVYVGHRFGARFGRRLEVAGGLVLIALAAKALIDHFRAGS
ncbi:MAG TPA: manganese efflux pump MntP family protein [Labilithrix sp.]|nr:manganese efflux pump MntP family protein [Labilithrix sp.]